MVRRVEDTFGHVSLLVNNAGVAGQALFQDVTEEMWRRYFGVNIDGAFHTIQAVLPPMLREHAGLHRERLVHVGAARRQAAR